jgi:hypothetical protein
LLFWNDRYGHGGEYIAYTNADAYAHTYADRNAYTHSYTDASPISYPDGNAYADGNSDADGHAYADGNSDADGHTYADGNSDADSNAYADGHTDAVHRKMYADTEAGSDSGAASHAAPSDSCHLHSCSYPERHVRGSYRCRG